MIFSKSQADNGENKLIKLMIQFIKFGIVGVSNTAVSLAVYYIFMYLNLNLYIGNALGFILGTLNAYIWNSKFVFKKDKERKNSVIIVKTYIGYAFSLLLSELLLFIWVDVLHIPEALAPVINLFITVPLNFLMNKLWVYGGKGVASEENNKE